MLNSLSTCSQTSLGTLRHSSLGTWLVTLVHTSLVTGLHSCRLTSCGGAFMEERNETSAVKTSTKFSRAANYCEISLRYWPCRRWWWRCGTGARAPAPPRRGTRCSAPESTPPAPPPAAPGAAGAAARPRTPAAWCHDTPGKYIFR